MQYNPETGVPYRDASGMLIYQTVFQADWLDRHPTFFNKKINVGSERNRADYEFNYTSASIIMRNANSFSEEELLEDQYADYYDRFANSSRNTLGGGQEVNLEGFKFRACLKTIVNGSEFPESNYHSSHHEHFIGRICCFLVISA